MFKTDMEQLEQYAISKNLTMMQAFHEKIVTKDPMISKPFFNEKTGYYQCPFCQLSVYHTKKQLIQHLVETEVYKA